MPMLEVAVYWYVVALLGTWFVKDTSALFRGPVMIELILEWIIVLICLIIVLSGGLHRRGIVLWP
jgi:hypothetical protein